MGRIVRKKLKNLATRVTPGLNRFGLKVRPRANKIASKLEAKITRALSTPVSRKKRQKQFRRNDERIWRICVFALTSAAIGSAIYFYPPARKLVVSSAVQLNSKISEFFSSANLEPDPVLENAPLPLESSEGTKLSRRVVVVLVTILAGLLIKQVGPSILSSFDGPLEAATEAGTESTVKSIADTPADDSTCGIGPEHWPSWLRICLQLTLQTVSIVYGSVYWNFGDLARAEQASEAAKLAAELAKQIIE